MSARRPFHRTRLVAGHGGRSVFLTVVFAAALVGGVRVHANTPRFRHLAADVANGAIAGLFEGKIVVGPIDELALGRSTTVRIARVDIAAPDGTSLVHAEGVTATIALERLLRGLLRGRTDVELEGVRIERADVTLDTDAAGQPLVATTFSRRRAATASTAAAPAPTTGGAGPHVHVAPATIASARVRGNMVPGNLDGDLADAVVEVTVADEHCRIGLARARTVLRSPRAPNQRVDLVATARGTLDVALADAGLVASATVDGAYGPLPFTAHGTFDRGAIDAALDTPRTAVADVRAAFDGLPLAAPAELHAKVKGTLPALAITADAGVGGGAVHATGDVDLRAGYRFRVDADLAHVDVAGLGQPVASDLSGRVHGEGVIAPAPIGTFTVDTEAGEVAGVVVPATVLEGRFEPARVVATLRATEKGVDGRGKIDVDLATRIAAFDLQARSSSLRALARAPNVLDGAAAARVQGTVDLDRQTIRATASASGSGLSSGAFHAKSLDASGLLTGPLRAPVIDASFKAQQIALATGEKRPLVYPEAQGRARLTLVPVPTLTGVSVTVQAPHGRDEPIVAEATSIVLGTDRVTASGLSVHGAGAPIELDVDRGASGLHVRARSAGIDVRRLGRLTGIRELDGLPDDTRAVFDVDVAEGGANGHVDLEVRSVKGIGAGAIATEVHGRIERGALHGRARLTAEGLGVLEIVDADVAMPARFDAASLARTTGSAEWRGTLDLGRGAVLFAGENVESVSGLAYLEGRVERGDPRTLPAVRATIRTDGLAVTYGDPASRAPARTLQGIDFQAHAAWDGRTDAVEVSALGWDQHGLLANASATSRIPVAALLAGSRKIDALFLAKLGMNAVAELPKRKVDELPELLRIDGLLGEVAAHAEVSGTMIRPRVAVTARAENVRDGTARSGSGRRRGVDGLLEARWDGRHAAVTFAVDERERQRRDDGARPADDTLALAPERARPTTPRKPGHVRGLVIFDDVRANDLLRGRPVDDLPWKADGEVEITDVNLARLPTGLGGIGLSGILNGRISLRDLNRAATFDLKGHVDGFGAGGATVDSLDVLANGRNGSLFARATMKEGSGSDTSEAIFQVVSQSPRIKGLELAWEGNAPTGVDYMVRNARLALLAPLFKSAVAELDGRANGAGSIAIEGTNQVFQGGLAIGGGRLYVNALGEEITNFEAIAQFERSGAWQVKTASGKIGTGEFTATAAGHLNGLSFVDAEATVTATKNVPLSSESATFAEATGAVHLTARLDDARDLLVAVELPQANVQLPDRSAQQLQPLAADPTIQVGVRHGAKLDTSVVRRGMGGTGTTRAVATSKKPLVTKLEVSLGKDVHLEGRGLDVSLGGKTLVDIADEVRVTGQVDLRSGTIEVHGRRFTVDRGTVTFPVDGDATNPTVVAAAYWDSPDRTRVWVEFTGPLKTGKLTLRSEPAYSKNEILSVLLFGRPDPNMATGATDQTGDASGATAVGTGFVASDLNLMLSELDENLDIETDTLSGNRARTKLGRSFFDRRLKVQVGYAPGRTYREPDTTYLFLNWQFIPQWSVVATRGDRGTSILDVLFQHRY